MIDSAAPRLVGREDELSEIATFLDLASDSGVARVFVGEAGIGKTALLDSAADLAKARGFTVLRTAGIEQEAGLPFSALHQILAPLGLLKEDGVHPDERLLVALGLIRGEAPDPEAVASSSVKLLQSASTHSPIVVIVDDAQWLDPETKAVVAQVARKSRGRASILLAIRAGHDPALVAQARERVDIRGVNDDAAEIILQSQGRDLAPAQRRRILREAGGNPLALLELPSIWSASDDPGVESELPELSKRLERAFADRATELEPDVRTALLVAATDQMDDEWEILAATRLMGVTDANPLAHAEDAGLITVEAGHVAFRHPLVRSAMLQSEPISRRHEANKALASVVEDTYRRTWHLAKSTVGPDDQIADRLEASAGIALDRGAIVSATLSMERAAELTKDSSRKGHRYLVAAEYAFGLGRADLVDRLLGAARATELSALDWARLQWLREIFNDGVPGDASRVLELCDFAEASAQSGDNSLALNLLLGAALRCWWADAGRPATAKVVEVITQLGRQASALQTDPRYVAALAVAEPVLTGAEVKRLLDRANLDALDDPAALHLFGMAAHAMGDAARASDLLDRAESKLRAQGRVGLLAQVLSMAVIVRLELGAWQRANEAAEEGIRLAEDTGQPIWTAGTIVCQARAEALRGNAERALELAERAELAANRQRLNDLLSCVGFARGVAYFAQGRSSDAYAAFRSLFDPNLPTFHLRERFDGVMFLAEAAVSAKETDDARLVVAELEDIATVTPSPILHTQLLYARAVLAPDERASELFEVALGTDLTRWPWTKARIELAYGLLLLRSGDPQRGRTLLANAVAVMEFIGATPWVRIARYALSGASAPSFVRQGE